MFTANNKAGLYFSSWTGNNMKWDLKPKASAYGKKFLNTSVQNARNCSYVSISDWMIALYLKNHLTYFQDECKFPLGIYKSRTTVAAVQQMNVYFKFSGSLAELFLL